jgi:hypothetical protein
MTLPILPYGLSVVNKKMSRKNKNVRFLGTVGINGTLGTRIFKSNWWFKIVRLGF